MATITAAENKEAAVRSFSSRANKKKPGGNCGGKRDGDVCRVQRKCFDRFSALLRDLVLYPLIIYFLFFLLHQLESKRGGFFLVDIFWLNFSLI